MLAVVLAGCGQTPSARDPGPSQRAAGPKRNLAKGADGKSQADSDRKRTDTDRKTAPTGPPTEKEVRTAAVRFLTQPERVKDVEVTFVSAPLDVPESKVKQLASPSTRDVRAYYVDFTATNLVLNERLPSHHYLLLVGRDGDGVKVLASYDNIRTVEQQMGKDWFTKNPPPQK
jgi:hypothetical protein